MSVCQCEKKKERDREEKKKLLHRLHRIEGQVRGLCRMVEEDAYCVDLLNQSSAVAAALAAFERSLLEGHLRGCVKEDLQKGGEAADASIEELVRLLPGLMK